MDNVHSHYVRANTPVIERGENDTWLMYKDRAVFVLNNITAEYDYLGYDISPQVRLEEMRFRLPNGDKPCSA